MLVTAHIGCFLLQSGELATVGHFTHKLDEGEIVSLLRLFDEVVFRYQLLCGLNLVGCIELATECVDLVETLLKDLGILCGVLNSLHFGDLTAEISFDFCDFSH